VLENKVDPYQPKMRSLRSYYEDSDIFRSMLVMAIEDSYEAQYKETARIQRATGKYCYAIVLKNNTNSNAYVIRFTNQNQVVKLAGIQKEVGITWRNVSANPKNNWRLSRQIHWF
jgi:hypothetical protein